MLEVRLLGPLEIGLGAQVVLLPGRRLSALVAILALSADRPVPVEVIADRLWGEAPPRRPKPTLQTYIARLRERLGDNAVETYPAGYRLRIDADRVDALRLANLVREAEHTTDDSVKRTLLETAAGLWRDTPFTGAASDWLTTGEASRLTEIYLTAVEQRIDLDLAHGRYHGLPIELQHLTAQYPLREPLWARLIAVLRLTGRTAEALERYEQIRVKVADELGVDPAPSLQREFALLVAHRNAEPAVPTATASIGPPRQLPSDLRNFTGRLDEQRRLDELLENAPADRPLIVALTGPGGIGKTSLAVQWAHRVRERFPDGQLCVNLRGFAADAPISPGAVLLTFLRSLQVPASQIPAETSDRAALFRTVAADRRLLVLIDNARNAAQVRMLLPASDSLVLITSRNQLRSLSSMAGAYRLAVEPLPPDHARGLLIAAVGARRVAAENTAVTKLTELCAGLPLALAVAAESAVRIPVQPFAELVGALQDDQRPLDVFTDPDDEHSDLRRVMSWSYQTLEPETARLFRLLGLLPAIPISVPVAAALVDADILAVERRLDQLDTGHLVRRIRPGQYQLHDLVRAYARELTLQLDDEPKRQVSIRRALEWYLHTLQNAALAASMTAGGRDYLANSPHRPIEFADVGTAMSWLWSEHLRFAPWIRTAISAGHDDHAWQLAWRLSGFLTRSFLVTEAVEVGRLGVEAAEHLGDPRARYLSWNSLGGAELRADRAGAAQDCARRAIAIARECGDVAAEVTFRTNLACGLWRGGELEQALDEMTVAERAAAGNTKPSAEPLQLSLDQVYAVIGAVTMELGRLEVAKPSMERSIRLARAAGKWYYEANFLGNLAELYERMGDDTNADFYAGEALNRLQSFPNSLVSFDSLAVRTRIAVRAGTIEEALSLGRQALAQLPSGHPRGDQLRELIDSLTS